MACKWHGRSSETHMVPSTHRFVTLCIPASLFHLFQQCDKWDDVRYLILDEVHKKMGLLMMFAYYYAYLRLNDDVRVQKVKLLMLSATLYGDVIEAIQAMFDTAGLLSASVTVQPSDSKERAAWHCADLWTLASPKSVLTGTNYYCQRWHASPQMQWSITGGNKARVRRSYSSFQVALRLTMCATPLSHGASSFDGTCIR